MHRYRLATYRECKAHREWNTTCPDCGRKGKFSPYIDTVTMQPVDDKRCGRCNRLSNCGYHLPPRMVARTEDFNSRTRISQKHASFHSRVSALPPTRMSVGCDDCRFIGTKECCLQPFQPDGKLRAFCDAVFA